MEILYTSYTILMLAFINNLLALLFRKYDTNLYCGLIGFSSSNKNPDLNIMKILVLWNSIERGTDSIGVYTPDSGIIKSTDKPYEYIKESHILKNLSESNNALIHVRKSSVGANSVRNAHPFRFGNIIGAHNGTLKDFDDLAKEYDIPFSSYFVDSEVIIRALSMDIENKNLNVLAKFKGAATLLMYDDKNEVFYVFKDTGRPLFYGYDKEGSMYISSIDEPLKFCDLENISSFSDNTFYVIKDSKIIKEMDILDSINSSPRAYITPKIAYTGNLVKSEESSIVKLENDTYTGIGEYTINSEVPMENLIGYHVSLSKKYTVFPKLETRKRYLIKKYNHLLKEFLLTDDKYQYWVPREFLSFSDFIPVAGRKVRAVSNLYIKNTQVVKKDEVVIVKSHSFPEKEIKIFNKWNEVIVAEKSFFNLLTLEEEYNALGKKKEKIEIEFNIDEILNV